MSLLMKLNELIEQAKADWHTECCLDHSCRSCGAHVSTYNANQPFVNYRPEAEIWDWWVACDNADCEHAYGEGLFQCLPSWIKKPPDTRSFKSADSKASF